MDLQDQVNSKIDDKFTRLATDYATPTWLDNAVTSLQALCGLLTSDPNAPSWAANTCAQVTKWLGWALTLIKSIIDGILAALKLLYDAVLAVINQVLTALQFQARLEVTAARGTWPEIEAWRTQQSGGRRLGAKSPSGRRMLGWDSSYHVF